MFTNDFGNKELAGMKEIVTPEPVPYVPQTIGWYILLTLIMIFALYMAFRWHRKWVANRYRTAALNQLYDIEELLLQPEKRAETLTAIPVLLKQTALKRYPRSEIAQLSGERWLAFLDKTYEGTDFIQGAGQLLPKITYQKDVNHEYGKDEEYKELMTLIRTWIKTHK